MLAKPIVIGITLFAVLVGVVAVFMSVEKHDSTLDKFEIKKIYPTTTDGRKWFAGWDDGGGEANIAFWR